MITVTAFKSVPEFAQGVVRDMRVRWALEEAGMPYEAKLLALGEQAGEANRTVQPFGQVPAIDLDGVKLFESGAIVLLIADRSEALSPRDPQGKARMTAWVLAALNSVEPPIQQLAALDLFPQNKGVADGYRPLVVESVHKRLSQLEDWLGSRDYLEDRFTAGDLMMCAVLRILRHTDIMTEHPRLVAYQKRCEARPAFKKALADHMKPFEKSATAA